MATGNTAACPVSLRDNNRKWRLATVSAAVFLGDVVSHYPAPDAGDRQAPRRLGRIDKINALSGKLSRLRQTPEFHARRSGVRPRCAGLPVCSTTSSPFNWRRVRGGNSADGSNCMLAGAPADSSCAKRVRLQLCLGTISAQTRSAFVGWEEGFHFAPARPFGFGSCFRRAGDLDLGNRLTSSSGPSPSGTECPFLCH